MSVKRLRKDSLKELQNQKSNKELQDATDAVKNSLDTHIKDKNNPHNVTLESLNGEESGTADKAVKAHNSSEDAHRDLFAKKQDVLKGKKGMYVGFTEDNVAGEVDAPMSGGSHITMTFAADFKGLTWTLTGGDETYTGTVDESLTAVVSVLGINTTYTLSAALSGTTYTAEVTTKDYYTTLSVKLEKFAATITVTVDSGSTVTATLGDTVLTKTSTGTAVFTVQKAGAWRIKATKGSGSASGTVTISKSGESKTLTLIYSNVFGVVWDTSNSSTALTRLTPETDPYGFVNRTISTEPVPAVGTGAGSSPFDDYMPWGGMKRCSLNAAGKIIGWVGDEDYDEGDAYIMVYIPEFYVAYKEDGDKKYFYISDKGRDGFVKHPGSNKYVGRYVCGDDGMSSETTCTPTVDITRSSARTMAKNIGSKFHLYDFVTYCALIFLYVIEFADWDSQSKIGKGYSYNSVSKKIIKTGGTDSMIYHTGRANGTDGQTAVQYRGIENLWGNVFQWVDGFISKYPDAAYYCKDYSKYADTVGSDYESIASLPSSGWINDLTVTDDGLIIPKGSGGSETTYIPDRLSVSSILAALMVGGHYTSDVNAGLLCFNVYNTSASYSSETCSVRLMCEP